MIVTIDNISQIVKILRFPLAISVVMIHIFINGCNNIFTYLLQNIIFLSVPLFFIISGFYFTNSSKPYKQKIKDRLKKIAIPYLIWNTIAWIVSLRNTGFTLPSFDTYVSTPIDFPLWFLRDLFFLCLIQPLILWLASKYKGLILIFCCFVLYYFEYTIPYLEIRYNSIFFFSIGIILNTYIKIKPFNITKMAELYIYTITSILFILTIIYRDFFKVDSIQYSLYIVLGCITMSLLLLRNIQRIHITQHYKEFGASSFFIYASHTILINGAIKTICTHLSIPPELNIFLISSFTCIICLLMFFILKKYSLSLLKILNGGRI